MNVSRLYLLRFDDVLFLILAVVHCTAILLIFIVLLMRSKTKEYPLFYDLQQEPTIPEHLFFLLISFCLPSL